MQACCWGRKQRGEKFQGILISIGWLNKLMNNGVDLKECLKVQRKGNGNRY